MKPSLRTKQYNEMDGGLVVEDPIVGSALIHAGNTQNTLQESDALKIPITEEMDPFIPAKGIMVGLALSSILWSMFIPLFIYFR